MSRLFSNLQNYKNSWVVALCFILLGLSGHTYSDAAQSPNVIAEIDLENGNQYVFLLSRNKDGVIDDVIMVQGERLGNTSLQSLGVEYLNPLNIFNGLKSELEKTPDILKELYVEDFMPSGWLADQLLIIQPKSLLVSCNDLWWKSRFGNLQSGYQYHDGPDDGVWLNTRWITFTWRRTNLDGYNVGVCLQDVDKNVLVEFKKWNGSEWVTSFQKLATQGSWWYARSSSGSSIQISLTGTEGNTFDIGFDYNK